MNWIEDKIKEKIEADAKLHYACWLSMQQAKASIKIEMRQKVVA